MNAVISKIEHFERKKDQSPISKVSFQPTLDESTGEIVLISPRFYDGTMDMEWIGKKARVE